LTVLVEIPSRAAICLLTKPSASSARISRSRLDRTVSFALSAVRPDTREGADALAIRTMSADGGTSALVAPTPTSSNSGFDRSAAARDVRNFSDAATMAMRVIVAKGCYAARCESARSTNRCTREDGTATPSPLTTMLLIPMSLPSASTRGPPELPGASRTSATIQRGDLDLS